MPRVLLTAFEAYGSWRANASWLTLVELTRDLPSEPQVTTRLYPVDFAAVPDRIARDLAAGYDYVLLTGQAPGRARVELETVALNLGHDGRRPDVAPQPLVEGGPAAYLSDLPAEHWVAHLKQLGIPAAVSRHAGTYLCNASLYHTLHLIATQGRHTRALFVHLPLDPAQAAAQSDPVPSLAPQLGARALLAMLQLLPQPVPMA